MQFLGSGKDRLARANYRLMPANHRLARANHRLVPANENTPGIAKEKARFFTDQNIAIYQVNNGRYIIDCIDIIRQRTIALRWK